MRKRAFVVGGVLVVSGIAGAFIANYYVPRGPMPSASTPVAVVAADYLAAAKNHDCGLTRALTAPDATWSWCDDPRLLSYKDVGLRNSVDDNNSPESQHCVDFTMTTTGSSDGTIPVGEEPWSLCFVHEADGWRVDDQGQG